MFENELSRLSENHSQWNTVQRRRILEQKQTALHRNLHANVGRIDRRRARVVALVERELLREPNPFADIEGVRYVHRPLNDPGVTARISAIDDPTERYRLMLDGNGERIAAIFKMFATCPRTLLFHCFAGRDRTGIVAAMLLRIAGVPDRAIVEDFAISDERLARRYDEWSQAWSEEDKARVERSIVEAEATIRGTLGHLDARYGGVEAYLTTNGLATAAIDRLRADLIGPGRPPER